MRILQVSDSYYPDPGGVSEVMHNLSGALRELGNDVTILTSRHPSAKKEENIVRVGKRISLKANRSEINWTFSPGLPFEVKNFLKNNQFDIIHSHGPFSPNLPFLSLLFSSSTNVATFHTAFTGFNFYKIAKFFFSGVARKLDGAICVSKKALSEIQPHFPKMNYKIIPNGIDIEKFNPEGKIIKKLQKSKNILFLGRLDPRKGLSVLIRALPIIKEEIPEIQLIVVGKGKPPYIDKKLKGSIIFTGKVSPDMVPAYYRSVDLYCSPALHGETFGIVLLEAMASGTPVIASNIEGYREVIPDREMLFEKNSPEELASKAISVLKNSDKRKRFIEKGLKTSRKYTWERVARDTLEFYRYLISKQNRNPSTLTK